MGRKENKGLLKMNEKKFSKKLDDMTAEERKRKEDIWEGISNQAGLNDKKSKGISLRFACVLAMCVFVVCIAIPIVVVSLSKPVHQAGGGDVSSSSEQVSTPSSVDDPNKFKDNEFYYDYSPKKIDELAKEDNNILYVDEWQRDEKSLLLMKATKDTDRIIGLQDKSYDIVNKYQISVDILYKDIKVVSMDKIISNMKNTESVQGVDIVWRSGDDGSYASFKYNSYTYFIQIHNNTSGDAALDVAKTLLATNQK